MKVRMWSSLTSYNLVLIVEIFCQSWNHHISVFLCQVVIYPEKALFIKFSLSDFVVKVLKILDLFVPCCHWNVGLTVLGLGCSQVVSPISSVEMPNGKRKFVSDVSISPKFCSVPFSYTNERSIIIEFAWESTTKIRLVAIIFMKIFALLWKNAWNQKLKYNKIVKIICQEYPQRSMTKY